MAQQVFAVGRRAKGICDVCNFNYLLHELRYVPVSAYGSPSNSLTNIRACPECWDKPHPQSFLSVAVAAHGADPEALRDPRPDIFPIAYSIAFLPSAVNPGTSTSVIAVSVYPTDTPVFTFSDAGITVPAYTPYSAQRLILNVSVAPQVIPGTYVLTISYTQSGTNLRGQLTVT